MEIIREGVTDKCVVALGNFDGLHIAHREVIQNAIDTAKNKGVKGAVLLFREHTQDIINKTHIKLITTEDRKLKLLQEMGVDIVYMHHFNSEFMSKSPREFAEFLVNDLNACAVSVGYDYRFGYKAEGDVDTLRELGLELGFEVVVTDEMCDGNEPIKSTTIRGYICSGEIEKANEMLGRSFSVMGKVVEGRQNGRKMGVPTANVEVSPHCILPDAGVYMGYTVVGDRRLKSVINVGNNPTFNADKTTVESHILNFSDDIYGKVIEVEFVSRIRGEIKFSGMDELKKQIEKDIEAVRGCI